MKRSILVAVIVMMVLGVTVGPASAEDTTYLRVLTYHRFDTGAWISTPMSQFTRQMDYLRENDYQFLTIEQVYHHIKSGQPFPERSVLIMIDDGYRSSHYNAFPYLNEHGIPAVLNIYPRAQDHHYRAYVGWDTVTQMAKNPLFHIGNHSYNHDSLIDTNSRSDSVVNEIRRARSAIKQHTGEAPVAFVLPYGEYDYSTIRTIQSHRKGPTLIFSSIPGVIRAGQQTQPYGRFMINRYTDMEKFKNILRRRPMIVETNVRDGTHFSTSPRTLQFQFKHLNRFDTRQINVFLNGKLVSNYFQPTGDTNTYHLQAPADQYTHWNQLMILGLDQRHRVYRMFSKGFAVNNPGETEPVKQDTTNDSSPRSRETTLMGDVK